MNSISYTSSFKNETITVGISFSDLELMQKLAVGVKALRSMFQQPDDPVLEKFITELRLVRDFVKTHDTLNVIHSPE